MALHTSTLFALDLNCQLPVLTQAIEFCRLSVLKAMCPSSVNEFGLVVAGGCKDYTRDVAVNVEGCDSSAKISAPCLPGQANNDIVALLHQILRDRENQRGSGADVSFIEILALCVEVFNLRKRKKQFRDVVYLFTDARAEVRMKNRFLDVLSALRSREVTLIVVGIDFSETGSSVSSSSSLQAIATALSAASRAPIASANTEKLENEAALLSLCGALGNGSRIITLRDALSSASELNCKRTRANTLKIPFKIGGICLSSTVFTRVKRTTVSHCRRTNPVDRAAGGRRATYSRLQGEETAGSQAEEEYGEAVGETPVAKPSARGGSLLGKDVKIHGTRGIDAVACVPQKQVPVYALVVDSSYVVTPVDDDLREAKAFRSVVKSLATRQLALIVRYVRSNDGNPNMFFCVPSTDDDGDVFIMSRLPFVEEIRCLRFPTLEEMEASCGVTETDALEEQKLVSSIVEGLTVGEEVLQPLKMLNPFIHQYYATQRAIIDRCCSQTTGDPLEAHDEADVKLALLPQLRGTSAAFDSRGCVVEKLTSCVREKLEACCRTFAYVPGKSGPHLDCKRQREQTPPARPPSPVPEAVPEARTPPSAPSPSPQRQLVVESVGIGGVCSPSPQREALRFSRSLRTMFRSPSGSSSRTGST